MIISNLEFVCLIYKKFFMRQGKSGVKYLQTKVNFLENLIFGLEPILEFTDPCLAYKYFFRNSNLQVHR